MRGLIRWVACFWFFLAAAAPLASANVVGTWDMTWNGVQGGAATFQADGSYHCIWFGTAWEGTWTLDADGVLTVSERPAEAPMATPTVWAAPLQVGSLRGKIRDTGGEFSLVPVKGGKL